MVVLKIETLCFNLLSHLFSHLPIYVFGSNFGAEEKVEGKVEEMMMMMEGVASIALLPCGSISGHFIQLPHYICYGLCGTFGGVAIVALLFFIIRRESVKSKIKNPPTKLISENAASGYTSKLISDASNSLTPHPEMHMPSN